MIRLFAIILLAVCPYIIWAQSFIAENDSTVFIEYNDGRQWVYKNIDGLTVGMTNEECKDNYGKYYQVFFFINNNRDLALTFDPEDVFAELLSNKGDTISLEVYTSEKYQKKIKKVQTWSMILYGLCAGLNAATAGYSTSYSTSFLRNGYPYTSISHSYDAGAAFQANMASNIQMQTLGEMMKNDRIVREQGYLKLNTVYPGEAIIGYMNIKHKKGRRLMVKLNIGECEFSYLWDVEKKKSGKN